MKALTAIHPLAPLVITMAALCVLFNPLLAVAAALVFILIAGAPEKLPQICFFIILALIPMDAVNSMGTRPDRFSNGFSLSIAKLIFPPAFAIMLWNHFIKKERLALYPQLLLALFFLSSLFISYLLNPPHYWSLLMLSKYAAIVLLFMLAANVLKTRRDIFMVMIIITASCVISASASLISSTTGLYIPGLPAAVVWGGHARMAGLQNYAEGPAFATMLLVALCIVARFAWVSSNQVIRFLMWILTGFLVLSIASTLARGGIVALAVIAVYALFRFKKDIPMWKPVLAAVILVVVVIQLTPPAFFTRMAALSSIQTDDTSMRRLGSNAIAMQLFSEQPLFGCGPGSFLVRYLDVDYRALRLDPDGAPEAGHGLYQTVACELGLAGLLFIGLLIGRTIWDFRAVARISDTQNDRYLKLAAEALEFGFLSLLITALFEGNQLHKYLWIMFAVAPALRSIAGKSLHETENPHSPSHPSP